MIKRESIVLLVCLCSLFYFQFPAAAQDEGRAVWQATRFEITVANPSAERALNARAAVSVRNIGRGAGTTLSLRINSKAEIKSVTIDSAAATYQARPEARGNAQRVAWGM